MIQFVDGPACGTALELRRAPIFLRVVIAADGSVDALDQLDDVPQPRETIHVYRLRGSVFRGIACSRGRGGRGCQHFLAARYVLHDSQPGEAVRDNAAWRAWASGQKSDPGQRGAEL